MSARDARCEHAPVLFEREPQRARIATLLDDVRDDRGALVLVEGPAGIGKTELVRLGMAMAADAGIEPLQARGGELEAAFPFGVVRQLFESAVASAAPAEHARLLAGAAGGARAVVAAESAEGPPADAHSVLHGLYWLVANLADLAPILIVVDDLHWADRPSLRFLAYLANRLEGLAVGLLLASRTGEAAHVDELYELGARADVLALPPLSEDGVSRLVAASLDGAVDTEFASACEQVTAGNPYLVRELLVTLAGDGVRPTAATAERLRTVAPKTVARAALARLARLSPAAGRLANAVTVLGLDANLSAAADLAVLDLDEAADAADVLAAASILNPGRPLAFAHPLVRSAIYAELPAARRGRDHRRAAGLLAAAGAAPQTVATHLLAADPTGDRWVVERSEVAGAEAIKAGAPDAAVRYLERALAEPPSPEAFPALLLRLGAAQASLGSGAASTILRRALETAATSADRAAAARELARSLHMDGRALEAARVLEATIARLDDPPPELEADLLVLTQSAMDARRHLAGRLGGARDRAGALDGPTAPIIQAVVAVDLAHTDGTASQAIELAERALAGAQAMRHGGGLSVAFYLATVALALGDRLSEANAILDRTVADAQDRGSLRDYQSGLVLRSWILHRRGRLRDAEADARLALEEAAPAETDVLLPWKLAGLAESLMELGELERAGELLGAGRAGPYDEDSILYQPFRDAGARHLLLTGEPEQALELLAAEDEWERRWGVRNTNWTSWRAGAALAHLALGNDDEARALAAENVARAKEFGAPRALGIALRAAGMAAGKAGLDQLTGAVEVLAGSQAELELLRTRVELGGALRRAGRPTDARAVLRTALDESDRAGAQALAERAREELRAAGGRPRRARVSGVEALTPQERRVAQMAAGGMTNRAIAEALFLTSRTIEMHLANAYRKLGIATRGELPDLLA